MMFPAALREFCETFFLKKDGNEPFHVIGIKNAFELTTTTMAQTRLQLVRAREIARQAGSHDNIGVPQRDSRNGSTLGEVITEYQTAAANQKTASVLREIAHRLSSVVMGDPSTMFRISPREFEALVEAAFREKGYDTRLTRVSRDGGRDLILDIKNELGRHRILVEVKRHLPDNPVTVEGHRQLVTDGKEGGALSRAAAVDRRDYAAIATPVTSAQAVNA